MPIGRPLIVVALLIALVPPLLPLFVPPSGSAAGGWLAFLGRFHPLLVHFPVVLVPLAFALDLVAARPALVWLRRSERVRSLEVAMPLLLVLGAISALVAFTLGVLLARGEGTTGTILSRHYWAASGVVSTMLVAAALRVVAARGSGPGVLRGWLICSRAVLVLALLLTVWTGHLGGQLTHGETYLTEHAPWRREPPPPPIGPDSPIFHALVQPVLRKNCTTCHGSNKVEGELRLDSFAALKQGGEHGPVVRAGDVDRSDMFRRVTLPSDHEDAMPAEGRPALHEEEVAILHWWIASGASEEATIGRAENPPDEVARLLDRATAPAGPLPLEVAAKLARATKLVITPISSDARDGLRVSAFSLASGGVDKALARLTPLAPFVREADLSHSDATDAAIATVAGWTNLRALNLAFTKVRGRGLDRLRGLTRLRTLNLAGTSLDPAAGRALASLGALEQLTLSGTPLAEQDIDSVASALPNCLIIAGHDFVKASSDAKTKDDPTAATAR
ncbi:MAG: c-type cytochrome domain-containing protein [Vicinamibacteraceae bacterium]